jgi:hypothetical protein
MSSLVIAPTLKTPSGHDHAFCTELIQGGGDSEVRILASDKFQPEPGLPALPFFSVDPYAYRWIHNEAKQSLSWTTLLAAAIRDLRKIDFASYDRLIFHTADPIYLTALARCLGRFRGTFYLGFTLPFSFWLRETLARRIVSVVSDLAISSVRRKVRLVLYSETGAVRFDHRTIKCHLKLGPVQSIEYGRLLGQHQRRDSKDPIKIGFFGAPLEDKGFRILLELAGCAEIQSRFQIRIFLPPGQQELVEKINADHTVVRASSESRDVPTYFDCMSSVDVVYTLYSPLAYKDRMSGIVQDAILAGKPLLITAGCTEMRRFVDRVAPGAYIEAEYSATEAAKSLAKAIEDVDGLLGNARQGTEAIRKLKTFEVFFDSGEG